MSKSKNLTKDVETFKGYSAEAHALNLPDSYIGAVKPKKFNGLLYDPDKNKIYKDDLNIPEGAQRVFQEILSNAGDNVDASRRAGINPGSIDVDVTEEVVTIKNGGQHIPIKKVSLLKHNGNTEVKEFDESIEEWTWFPSFIFGSMRTSDNYKEDKVRMGCGRNGFGAKLTNIFSKFFMVNIEDPESKLRYRGIWKDNMFKDDIGTKPDVTIEEDDTITKGSVSVSWKLDFPRFKMKKYSLKDIHLFARFTLDFSFTCKIITNFNGKRLDFRNIKDYASLFWNEEQLKNTIVWYSWGKDTPKTIKNSSKSAQEKTIIEAKKPDHIPEVEIMIIDDPDAGNVISYCNGLINVEGGVHVDAVQEPVFKFLCNIVNTGKKKNKEYIKNISSKNIKSHISFIVNARLPNPEYTSQTKVKLAHPPVEVTYNNDSLKVMEKWKIISRLYAEMEAMAFSKASKTDGSKRKHISLDKGEDANFAGTKKSLDCTAWIVEGDSATGYPREMISHKEGGKDLHGLFPLKGKFLNCTKASLAKYANNGVVSYIKKFLGLREDVDYSDHANIKTLRYGNILITVDADDDGMHILAHILNFFREKYPGILKRNMIGYLRTPVIKLFKNGKIFKRFFTVPEFEKWKEKNSMRGLVARYYKGLGTSNKDDVKDDLKIVPTVICFYDQECEKNFDLAFHPDNSDARKEWIEKWRDIAQTDDILSVNLNSITKTENKLIQGQDISQLLNRELVQYSVSSLYRCIPSKFDFLKKSQRKILWAALTFFNFNPKKGKSIKVGRFCNKAADMTQYHHGETSLIKTFIGMTQEFIGSNNMPYFKQDGQFGTRFGGGSDAADARYSESHLSWWIPYVYDPESLSIVENLFVDDEKVETQWIPGVIPIGIVNGTQGTATGFSTSTPSHNPLDVVKWFKEKCQGKEPKRILPWYNRFTGRIKIINRDDNTCSKDFEEEDLAEEFLPGDFSMENPVSIAKEKSELDIEKLNEENSAFLEHCKHSKLRLTTYGKYEVKGFHKNDGPIITITELPIRTWTLPYRKWLEHLVLTKNKTIYDFRDKSTPEKVHIEIDWNKESGPINHKTLRLVRSFGISNITLIDHKGFPERFSDINETMENYYIQMIDHYNKVRENRIDIEEKNLVDISYKMKFIALVLNNEITIIKEKEDVIRDKMSHFEIPFEYYEKSKGKDFSVESYEKYKDSLEEAKIRLEKAKETTAENIWITKLTTLEVELKKRYKKGYFDMKT